MPGHDGNPSDLIASGGSAQDAFTLSVHQTRLGVVPVPALSPPKGPAALQFGPLYAEDGVMYKAMPTSSSTQAGGGGSSTPVAKPKPPPPKSKTSIEQARQAAARAAAAVVALQEAAPMKQPPSGIPAPRQKPPVPAPLETGIMQKQYPPPLKA